MPSRLPLAAFLLAALIGCDRPIPVLREEVPVTVGLVALDASNAPVVVLEERDGDRWLPIWIGTAEATSIAAEMDEQSFPRPNTHDLANQLILGLRGELERVVVTELRGNTYYAVMSVRSNGEVIEIDSRPSDAIAIALRADAPIYVRASVFGEASAPAEDDQDKRKRIHFHPSKPDFGATRPTGTSSATGHRTL